MRVRADVPFRLGRRKPRTAELLFCFVPPLCAACGDDDDGPADVAGQYTVNVTNGDNACLAGWQEGQSFTDITLTLVQDGENVQGTFQGLVATLFLDSVLGSNTFQGTVSARRIEMTRLGTRSTTSGACTFTVRADLAATSEGDLIEGQIVYTPVTNDDPNCASIEDCRGVQMFNGTRPP